MESTGGDEGVELQASADRKLALLAPAAEPGRSPHKGPKGGGVTGLPRINTASMMRLAAAVLVLVLLAIPSAPEAQPTKISRIGILSGGSAAPPPLLDAFRQTLRDLGHHEGRNILIEYRSAEAKPERLPGLAQELVRLHVDVIVAINTPASQAAKAATSTIPIVFTWVVDPLSLVTSLARPGANVTGVTTMTGDLSPKRLEFLKETLPKLSRVAVLNAGNPTATRVFKDMESAGPRFGIQLQALGVRDADDIHQAVDAAARAGAEALFVIEETVLAKHRTLILDLAAKRRLPTASTNKEFVQAGGLVGYGVNLPDMFRMTARYVDRILRGAKPADLPVEQPTKLELVINLKTAKALGLTIPPSLLLRADQVIE
jgi:putative ABC transport system substrate-binding protein